MQHTNKAAHTHTITIKQKLNQQISVKRHLDLQNTARSPVGFYSDGSATFIHILSVDNRFNCSL